MIASAFPLAFAIISFIGGWTVYGLAIRDGHVCPFTDWARFVENCSTPGCCDKDKIPFVSTVGARPTESSLFSAAASGCAFLMVIISILRYAYGLENRYPDFMNKCSLVADFIAAAGIFTMGHCQVINIMVMHIIGVVVAFVFASFGAFFQAMVPAHRFAAVRPFRILFCCLVIPIEIIYVSLYVQVKPNLLVISALFEWMALGLYTMYYTSFAVELYDVTPRTLARLLPGIDSFRDDMSVLTPTQGS
uniref:Si:dkey-228d14.5 n=1 Tax=Eptatretus burgeri TaxID=7764 RepID=A0A8C4R2E0_EPTBU